MPRWTNTLKQRLLVLRRKEDQLSLVLSLLIGAVVGLVVVAFIVLTGRLAARMYPAGGAGWRRLAVPVLGSLASGFLLSRYFPFARGSGIPQTKFALFINDGRITLRTVAGKFICCSVSLASGIALGREGPSVQIGAGIASVIGRKIGLSNRQVKALVFMGCAAALAAAMDREPLLLDPSLTVGAALELAAATSDEAWPVADAKGLHAMLRREQLDAAHVRGEDGQTLHAILRETTPNHFPHVHADHPLSAALERMGSSGLRTLPVVSRANARQILGVVALEEVIKAYGIRDEG